MRGRIPQGPEAVEQYTGSEKAKLRLRVILEALAGKLRVSEACTILGICEQRFRQLRAEALRAALASLEDQPPGRPRQAPEPEEVAALRHRLEALERELQVAEVREEIALALPHARPSAAETAAQGKKRLRHR
jgi:transposase-like protein